ncbi:MAG: NYN domain-containing protein, partial [Peptoniphilaceae bacterium]|nr:NYN domain-containing protein [Peptoniphilaceae bacterium]
MALSKRNILYVDGYNIINSWKKLKDLSRQSLEEARELLIS